MKSILKDIIQHTSLGSIGLIKVTGTDTETKINAVSENRTVITGTFKAPIADFIGVFGMPNLGKLKTILSFDEYDDSSIITVQKNPDDNSPNMIHFETKNKDFVNDYRLMTKVIVEDQVKTLILKTKPNWNVEFEPSVLGIQKLKKQYSANSEETVFKTKLENGNLSFYMGDPATNSGNFVFQAGVAGTLQDNRQWHIGEVVDILSLPGDKVYRISDQGLSEITVDSGIAVYSYLLPAQTK